MNVEQIDEYIKYLYKNHPKAMKQYNTIFNWCRELNNLISEEQFATMADLDHVLENNSKGNLTKSQIVKMVELFFASIDKNLENEFLNDLENNNIRISEEYSHNHCSYCDKKINGEVVSCRPIVFIKYTGSIDNAIVLAHEYMHLQTEKIGLLMEKTIDKETINIKQELVSIFFEFAFIKFYSNSKLDSSFGKILLARIYESFYLKNLEIKYLLTYCTLIKQGVNPKDFLEKNGINEEEMIDIIDKKSDKFLSFVHFFGTFTSISIMMENDIEAYCKKLYTSIYNLNVDEFNKLTSIKINCEQTANFIQQIFNRIDLEKENKNGQK